MENLRYEVLIIDDDPISRKLLHRFLPENKFWCQEEENISGVVDFLIENSPHLIFLDLNLPDINGFDFIKESKDLIPEDSMLVIVSSYGDKKYVQRAKELGVDEYIIKPVKPSDIKRVTSHFMKNREELIKSYDDKSFEVQVDGTIIGLGENNLIVNFPLSFEDGKNVEIHSRFLSSLEITRTTFQATKMYASKLRTKKSNVFKLIGISPKALNNIRAKVIRWMKILG